jgi:hypothetical protein
MVTAIAVARMATTVATAAAKTTATTAMAGGTDNNQLKAAAEETAAAAATETAMAIEMATRRHSKLCGDMPNYLKRWKAWS